MIYCEWNSFPLYQIYLNYHIFQLPQTKYFFRAFSTEDFRKWWIYFLHSNLDKEKELRCIFLWIKAHQLFRQFISYIQSELSEIFFILSQIVTIICCIYNFLISLCARLHEKLASSVNHKEKWAGKSVYTYIYHYKKIASVAIFLSY